MSRQIRCANTSIRRCFHLHRQGIRKHHDAGNYIPAECLVSPNRRSRSTDGQEQLGRRFKGRAGIGQHRSDKPQQVLRGRTECPGRSEDAEIERWNRRQLRIVSSSESPGRFARRMKGRVFQSHRTNDPTVEQSVETMTRRRPRSAMPTAMAVARFSTSMRRRRMSRIASSERLTVGPRLDGGPGDRRRNSLSSARAAAIPLHGERRCGGRNNRVNYQPLTTNY